MMLVIRWVSLNGESVDIEVCLLRRRERKGREGVVVFIRRGGKGESYAISRTVEQFMHITTQVVNPCACPSLMMIIYIHISGEITIFRVP